MINKSASPIGILQFSNGNKTALFIGANSNTGETIVWQSVNGRRATRTTGRNIAGLAGEVKHVLDSGEATWVETPNKAALSCLFSVAKS